MSKKKRGLKEKYQITMAAFLGYVMDTRKCGKVEGAQFVSMMLAVTAEQWDTKKKESIN